MVVKLDEDELIEHWTLVVDELGQVAGKRGTTRLGFSLLLKFYARHGRFPRGRGELPDAGVAVTRPGARKAASATATTAPVAASATTVAGANSLRRSLPASVARIRCGRAR